ncbi:unnamed protein product [Moneuplotes crassus]|uniref:Uncharacterized protein n=1 Tax=Euplotes crassus TaxID=5936 RepID=A0AAD1Y5H6_EUPCR|nr:unnamed protein product [Moneuplotes crassus]
MEQTPTPLKTHLAKIQAYSSKGDWLGLSNYCNENEIGQYISQEKPLQDLLIRIMETLLEDNINSEAKDCYAFVLSMLLCNLEPDSQENKNVIGKLFLQACGSSQLELVKQFSDHDTELIDTKFIDSKGRGCFRYAADGNGDNFDVIEYMLNNFEPEDNGIITDALLYFLKRKDLIKIKAKSIKEFFKRIDLLDLCQKDYYGNTILHYMVLSCDKLTNWKDDILTIIKSDPSLFFMKNNEGGSPKTIDAQRNLGIAKLLDQENLKEISNLGTKDSQSKQDGQILKEPSPNKNSNSQSEDPFIAEEVKSPSRAGEKNSNKRDSRKKKKDNPKESSAVNTNTQTPNQQNKKAQAKNQKEGKKEVQKEKKQKNKKDKPSQNIQNTQAEPNYKEKLKNTIESNHKKNLHKERFNREENAAHYQHVQKQDTLENCESKEKCKELLGIPSQKTGRFSKPTSPNVGLDTNYQEHNMNPQTMPVNQIMGQIQQMSQYQFVNQNHAPGMMQGNINPQNISMFGMYPNMAQNPMQFMMNQNLHNEVVNPHIEGMINTNNTPVQNHHNHMNFHTESPPLQQHMNNRDHYNNTGHRMNNNERGDWNFNNKKQDHQQSVPTFIVDVSTPEKLDEFFHERCINVAKRITFRSNKEEKLKDLNWTIAELEQKYQAENQYTEAEIEEASIKYFEENHHITSDQTIEMVNYVKNILEQNPEVDIDNDNYLQETLCQNFNKILLDNEIDTDQEYHEDPKEEIQDPIVTPEHTGTNNQEYYQEGYVNHANSGF